MIYISTGGLKSKTGYESINSYLERGIFSIELSGGKYEECLKEKLKLIKNNRKNLLLQVHNYFPPPKEPFVLNLGSLDFEIASKSFKHVVESINLAASLGAKYYSFHAGFLLDPKVNELGKKINKKSLYDRDESLNHFIERVIKLASIAAESDITLLIENNVLSHKNFEEFGENILLMVEQNECQQVMEKINLKNVKMLVDVAHLKVSSNSLSFSPELFLSKLDKWIAAYHFSENNGLSDDNEKFTEESWFWPYIKKDLDYYSIEVYNISIEELLEQRNLATNMIFN